MSSNLETPMRVKPYWEPLLEDIDATVAEYEENGYDGTALHPGPVTVLGPGAYEGSAGLSVLLPKSAYETLEGLVEDADPDGIDVYASVADQLVLLGLFIRFEAAGRVLGLPAYYDRSNADAMLEWADEHGNLDLHLRTLGGERLVLSCVEPDRFVPTDEEAG
ncbi:hypothetical protein ACLI4R_08360 [Natrialbaceae archaeon A-chndr2]